MTKPNHCIWPIRTHYTFVSTNQQFAPDEDDLAMVQQPSTITILYIWSLEFTLVPFSSANKDKPSKTQILKSLSFEMFVQRKSILKSSFLIKFSTKINQSLLLKVECLIYIFKEKPDIYAYCSIPRQIIKLWYLRNGVCWTFNQTEVPASAKH